MGCRRVKGEPALAVISGCEKGWEVEGEEEDGDRGQERAEVAEEQKDGVKRAVRIMAGSGWLLNSS